jgi:predicted membrane protein DUF2142
MSRRPSTVAGAARSPERDPQSTRAPGTRAFQRGARRARGASARRRRRRAPRERPRIDLVAIGQRLRAVPRAAWICAAIASLNAACWSLVNPPFQIPDEPAHFAYSQQLAENRSLPTSSEMSFSPEEQVVLRDLHQYEVHGSPEVHTIGSAAEQRRLQEDLERHLSRRGGGGVEGAYSSPPLYYLLQTVPYELAAGGSLLDQLQLMRLFSALFAGASALFVFLFVRESLPSVRWAWTVAGLAVALAPLLGFMSGAMNPDAMLTAVCAVGFYCLARGFKRGLGPRLAIAIGTITAVGLLTKANFIGVAPGMMLGVTVLSVRAARVNARAAYRALAIAVTIALAPVCLYVLANLLSGHAALGVVSSNLKAAGAHDSILGKLSYVWQLYLPRLPWMKSEFPGLFTARQLWFDRWVGFYGWLDTSFPSWVDDLALVGCALLVPCALRSLIVARAQLRRRWVELAVYATIGIGLLLLIGLGSFSNRESEGLGFAEPRYLLPLLPVAAAGLALSARGAGRRWGPVVGVSIVVGALAHDVFSQLLVVGRFYG